MVFVLYEKTENTTKDILTYKENIKVVEGKLDLFHFKKEVYLHLFEYIVENYDRFKV